MTAPVLLALLLLAVVLGVSGAAKLHDRQAVEDMFVSLRVPVVPPAPGARVLPYAELVLAAALLLAPGVALVVASALTLAVFTAYLVLIARATRFDPRPTCACFGSLGGHRVDASTVVRNGLLVALAAVALGGVLVADERWVPAALTDLGAEGLAWVAVAAAAVAVGWLAGRGSGAADAGVPDELADYERTPIPYGAVEDSEGVTTTLRHLTADKARLLVLLSLGCGPCARVAESLDGWADDLDDLLVVHPVYAVAPVSGLPDLPHRRETTLHDPEGNVARVFGDLPTPAAVLLGADGLLAGGPVIGQPAIERMVDELREAAAEARQAETTG